MKTKCYYAIGWTYGRAVAQDGTRLGSVHAFTRREHRDAWVAEADGTPSSKPGARDTVMSDRDSREALKEHLHDYGYCEVVGCVAARMAEASAGVKS